MATGTVTGRIARVLASQLTAQGYQVDFPPGRDPATFAVINLPGTPDVEITAEDNGQTSCHYIGHSLAEAAAVIARLRAPGHVPELAANSEALIGTWDGIAVEWHYEPSAGWPTSTDKISAALLAHLAILTGRRSRRMD